MSYEDQLYREVTGEHQERAFNPFGEETLEDVGENVDNETGDQQGGIWDERSKTWIRPSGTVQQGRRPMFKPFDQ